MKKLFLFCATAVFPFLVYASPQVLWKYKTQGHINGSSVIMEDRISFGSSDGNVYMLDKAQGILLWKFDTKSAIKSTPAVKGDRLFVNNAEGEVFGLDVTSGKKIWSAKLPKEQIVDFWDYYFSSPVLHDNLLILGNGDGNVYALDQQDGKVIWSFQTNGVVHGDPLIYKDKVYIGSYSGYFYALDALTGSLDWQFKTVGDMFFTKGDIQNGASVFNDQILFGSRDFNIYALNANTGTGMWNMKEVGSWIIGTPAISDSLAFVGTSDTHAFYCFDAIRGTVAWKLELNMRIYGKADFYKDCVIFGCFDGKLYAVNKRSGQIEWTFKTEGHEKNWQTMFDENGNFSKDFSIYGDGTMEGVARSEEIIMNVGAILSSPVVKENIVYFGSGDGNFYALQM